MTEKAKEGGIGREGRRVSFDVRVRQIGRPTDADVAERRSPPMHVISRETEFQGPVVKNVTKYFVANFVAFLARMLRNWVF